MISGPSSLNGNENHEKHHNAAKNDDSEDLDDADEAETKSPQKPIAEKKVATAEEKTATEEVNVATRSEEVPEMTGSQLKQNGNSKSNGKIDLMTVAELTKWVNNSVNILGNTRTETVLDFAELTGHLSPEIKNILVKLINRIPVNGNGHDNGNGNGNGNGHNTNVGHPTSQQLLLSLIELEGLLGMNNKSDELTLLALICQEVER